jgi:two-component system phosphate regulon sensor histidine kinase PhoR
MIQGSLLWRLYAGYVALILLFASLVALLVSPRVERASMRDIEASLENAAVLLSELARPWLAEGADAKAVPDAAFQTTIHDVGRRIPARLTVIAPDGTVLADSNEDPNVMENHGRRPEVLDARNRGMGQTSRFSETLHQRMMYMALRVEDDGRLLGYVRTSLPLETVDDRLTQIRLAVGLATAFVAMVALLGGYLFSRRITLPLRSMTQLARSMALGNYQQSLHVQTHDEVATLAEAFNIMRERLKDHVATIERDRNKILAIFRSMKEGVVAVDGTERIVHINAAAGEILGVDAERSHGERYWEAIRTTGVTEMIRQTLEGAGDLEAETSITQGMLERFVELQASALRSAEGTLTGAVLVLHDVSEVRRLQDVRSDFVSNVSHELKTPVAAIRGLVESILEDPQMESDTRTRFLERARNQCNRLSSLVTDLLSLSAIETRHGARPEDLVDLGRVLRQALAGQMSAAEARRITLQGPDHVPNVTVMGDEEDLRQVFDNLLSNAIRYTPEGGRIWVRMRADGDETTVEVQDTGIGIEPQHRERIFERFYRADKARSRELGGTGLGLAIVKHIVLNHGGAIAVESVPGEGSTFRVELPQVDEHDAEAP